MTIEQIGKLHYPATCEPLLSSHPHKSLFTVQSPIRRLNVHRTPLSCALPQPTWLWRLRHFCIARSLKRNLNFNSILEQEVCVRTWSKQTLKFIALHASTNRKTSEQWAPQHEPPVIKAQDLQTPDGLPKRQKMLPGNASTCCCRLNTHNRKGMDALSWHALSWQPVFYSTTHASIFHYSTCD